MKLAILDDNNEIVVLYQGGPNLPKLEIELLNNLGKRIANRVGFWRRFNLKEIVIDEGQKFFLELKEQTRGII